MKTLASLLLLVLLGVFFLTNNLKLNKQPPPQPIGSVTQTQGVVMIKNEFDTYFKNLAPEHPISSPAKILTGFDSFVTFNIGEDFKLYEQSQIEIKQQASKTQIILKHGVIERLDPELNNVEIYVAKKLQTQSKVEAVRINTKIKSVSPNKPLTITKNETAEFQNQLKNTFRLHQRFLERCFIKHYERKSGKTNGGDLLLRFTVDEKGALTEIKIIQSDIEDDKYHSCIREVVSRIRIRYYDKKVRTVNFPIQIRLPI